MPMGASRQAMPELRYRRPAGRLSRVQLDCGTVRGDHALACDPGHRLGLTARWCCGHDTTRSLRAGSSESEAGLPIRAPSAPRRIPRTELTSGG